MNAEILHDAIGLLPSDLITPVDALRSAPRKRKQPWGHYGAIAACLALVLWGSGMLFDRLGVSTEDMAQQEALYGSSNTQGMGMPMEPADGVMQESKQEAPQSTECDCAPTEVVQEGAPLAPTGEDIAIEPTGYPSGPNRFYVGGSTGYSPALGHKEGMEYPYATVIRSREALDGWFAEYRDFYDIDSFEAGYAHLDDSYFQHHDLLLVMLESEYGYVYQEPYYLNALQKGKWQLIFTAHYQQEDRTEEAMQWLYFIELEKGLIGETDSIEVLPEPYAVPEEGYVEAVTIPAEPTEEP